VFLRKFEFVYTNRLVTKKAEQTCCRTRELYRTAITQNPDAKFLMVKMYKELMANDNFSTVSIQMLLLKLALVQKSCGMVRSFLHG
jgi:hypothetical protein